MISISLEAANTHIKETLAMDAVPTATDVEAIRALCQRLSERAAVYMAIALFSLWRLQRASFEAAGLRSEHATGDDRPVAVAYCGAVADKHSTIRQRCQDTLDLLVETDMVRLPKRRLVLEAAQDAALLGAAVGAIQNSLTASPLQQPTA